MSAFKWCCLWLVFVVKVTGLRLWESLGLEHASGGSSWLCLLKGCDLVRILDCIHREKELSSILHSLLSLLDYVYDVRKFFVICPCFRDCIPIFFAEICLPWRSSNFPGDHICSTITWRSTWHRVVLQATAARAHRLMCLHAYYPGDAHSVLCKAERFEGKMRIWLLKRSLSVFIDVPLNKGEQIELAKAKSPLRKKEYSIIVWVFQRREIIEISPKFIDIQTMYG